MVAGEGTNIVDAKDLIVGSLIKETPDRWGQPTPSYLVTAIDSIEIGIMWMERVPQHRTLSTDGDFYYRHTIVDNDPDACAARIRTIS